MRSREAQRILIGVLAFGLLVVMAVPAGAAGPVPAGKWAKKVCGAVGAWLVAVDEAASVAPAPAGDLLAVSAQFDALLGDTGQATRALVKQVKQAGVPDLPKGAKIAKVYRDAYGELAAALGDTHESLSGSAGDLAALTSAQAAFETALTEVQEQIDAADVLASKPLTKALRLQPACVTITG